jgi:hypothetical protein
VKFVEKWYPAKHLPSHLTRLYQFLLRLIWMRGTITTIHAQRLGYNTNVVKMVSSNGYMEIHNKPDRPSEVIQHKIITMIGKAPRWIYA